MRATHLLVKGHVEKDTGEKCCICGCGTSADLKGKDFFGDTFRDYREMQARLSPYICSMCALSLKDVPSGVVTYLDGSQKKPRSALRGLGWRFFSWYLVEGGEPIGATKAHCKELREVMRHPPVGKRFAIVIADSGQKQLIYRLEAQRIERDGMPYLVQFETEQVLIDDEFWRMLGIADMLASVIGKTRILEPASYLTLSKCLEAYGDSFSDDFDFFSARIDTPKARLCGFLALKKEET